MYFIFYYAADALPLLLFGNPQDGWVTFAFGLCIKKCLLFDFIFLMNITGFFQLHCLRGPLTLLRSYSTVQLSIFPNSCVTLATLLTWIRKSWVNEFLCERTIWNGRFSEVIEKNVVTNKVPPYHCSSLILPLPNLKQGR
jgi:hypothetical protein